MILNIPKHLENEVLECIKFLGFALVYRKTDVADIAEIPAKKTSNVRKFPRPINPNDDGPRAA
jgi:hypothetical protein